MKERALNYYNNGIDCTRCVLMAARDKHKTKITQDVIASAGALSNGFGIGSFCGCLIAALMVLSCIFGEEEAKNQRILLLSDFHYAFGEVNCQALIRKEVDCSSVIGFVCDWLENIGV